MPCSSQSFWVPGLTRVVSTGKKEERTVGKGYLGILAPVIPLALLRFSNTWAAHYAMSLWTDDCYFGTLSFIMTQDWNVQLLIEHWTSTFVVTYLSFHAMLNSSKLTIFACYSNWELELKLLGNFEILRIRNCILMLNLNC